MENSFLVICVNYYTYPETLLFIEGLFSQTLRDKIRLIIVDNSKDFKKKDMARKDNILIYQPERNLGYFPGAWWALKKYCEKNVLPNWIIVSNSDIEFCDTGFFEKVVKYYHSNPPAIIAPDIILCSNSLPSSYLHQNPHFKNRPSKMRMLFYKWVSCHYLIYITWEIFSSLRYKIFNFLKRDKFSNSFNPCKIYAPFGAFVIFHKKYFECGGTLDYPCLIFGEEIFLAETARRLGLEIIYDPRLKVIHREHSSLSFIKLKNKALHVHKAATYSLKYFC